MTNKEIKLLKNKLFLNSEKYTIYLAIFTWLLISAVIIADYITM